MQLNNKIKCFYFLSFLVLLSVVCSCSLSRYKTTSQIITVTKIDTVFKYIPDTIPIIKTVNLTDTVIIENNNVLAKSFIDTIKKAIVLSVALKPVNVPVKINQIKTVSIKSPVEKKPYKALSIILIVLIGFAAGVIMSASFIIKRFKL